MNEFIIRKGYIALEDSQITGSLSVTNAVTASFFTGSYRGDGSQLTGIEGFPFTGSAGITGSLTVVGPVNATTFTGDGSQLTGIEGFPFTGSAKITGSLEVTGSVTATSFTGSLQGTATSASYVQLANIDGFTAYSASVNTAIDSVLDATTPLTATVNTTNSPFTITSQSIVIIDSTNGDVTVNLPDLDLIDGTPDQKPILLYKNDYSQNVIYVQPSGSQLVNGTTQDIIVSIQIGIAYNPTSAGWVTEGTSYQSLAELELFFVPRTETGSFATTGSNQFSGSQTITGSLTVTGGIVGTTSTASYVEYANVANKPAIVSGSSQITYSGLTGIPSGIVSGSAQIASFGIFATTGSNQFNGNQSITGSLTVSGQVVAQTLNVQQVTSSIVYSSGSNIFGNDLSNTQQFTGSVSVTGSLTVAGAGTFTGPLTGSSAIFTANEALTIEAQNSTAANNTITGYSANLYAIAVRQKGSSAGISGTNFMAQIISATGAEGLEIYTPNNKELILGTNATTRMTIGTTGAVGINSYTSTIPLEIKRFAGSGGTLRLIGNDNVVGMPSISFLNDNGGGGASIGMTSLNQLNLNGSIYVNPTGNVGIGSTSPSATLDVGSNRTLSGTDPISIYTDVRVASAVTGGLIGYNLRMVALAGSYTVANMYGIKTNTPVVQSGVTVTNSYGIYIGRTDDPTSGGVVTNKYALVTEATAGNVGIGTTTPSERLEVVGNIQTTVSGGDAIVWAKNGTVSAYLVANTTGGSFGLVGTSTNHDFILRTNNTERMRITSGGNVGIGTSSPNKLFTVRSLNNDVTTFAGFYALNESQGVEIWYGGIRSGGANTDVTLYLSSKNAGSIVFETGGGDKFSISSTGILKSLPTYNNTTGVAANVQIDANGFFARSTSSLKYKKDIRNYDKGLDLINLLRPVYYKGKSESDGDKQFAGLIAEEVHDLGLTEFVQYAPDGSPDALSYQNMIALAIKAIQEQQSQIEILKAEIQTLKQ